MKPTRWGWAAAGAGFLAFLLAADVFPWVLERMGVDPRQATAYAMDACLLVAPVGMIGFGVVGVGFQQLHASGALSAAIAFGLAGLLNGVAWGALVEAIRWSRIRARWLFLTLVLMPLLYVMMFAALYSLR